MKKLIKTKKEYLLAVFFVLDIILPFLKLKYPDKIKIILQKIYEFCPISYYYIDNKLYNFINTIKINNRFDDTVIYYYYFGIKLNFLTIFGVIFLYETIFLSIRSREIFIVGYLKPKTIEMPCLNRKFLALKLFQYVSAVVMSMFSAFFCYIFFMAVSDNMRMHPVVDIAQTGGIYFIEAMPTYIFVILFIVYEVMFMPKHKKGIMI